MLSVALKTLRARKGAFAGTFLALACASCLVTASGVLVESGLRASVEPYRYAGAEAVLGGDPAVEFDGRHRTTGAVLPEPVGLPRETVQEVAGLSGVRTVVGDHRLSLDVVSPERDGEVTPVSGHGWDTAPLGPFTLVDGEAPGDTGEVVVDAPLAETLQVTVGDRVELVEDGGIRPYEVSGVAGHEDDARAREHVLFLHPDEAARLSPAPDSFQAVGVVAEEGADVDRLADELAAAVPDAVVYEDGTVDRVEFIDVGEGRSLLLLVALSFGGLALLIALFVATTTLALVTDRRLREFAVLRAIGATPRQVARMVCVETLSLSLIAGVSGSVPGVLVAEALRSYFAHLGAVPADLTPALGPLPFLVAVLLVVATAVVGTLGVAASAARTSPVEALRETRAPGPVELPGWRRGLGLLCLVLGVSAAMTPLGMRTEAGAAGTGGAVLVLVLGIALLGPALTGPLLGAAGRLLRRLPVSGFLAAAATAADPRRFATLLTPLVLAVGFTLTMVTTQSVLGAAAERQVDEGLGADAVLRATGSSGVPPQVVARVSALPETGAESILRETSVIVRADLFGDSEPMELRAQGVSAGAAGTLLDPGVVAGDLSDLRPGTVALESSSADLAGVGVGDELEVVLGDGTPATVRLVAEYERGLGFGQALFPEQDLEAHSGPPRRLLVGAAEGYGRQRLEEALASVIADQPGLEAESVDDLAADGRSESRVAAWINFAGLGVILAYVAIGVLNSLVMATAGRSREFALLRLIGTERRLVVRTVLLETVVLVAAAVLLGTIVALVPLSVLSVAFLGSPFPPWPEGLYVMVVGATALICAVAVLAPTTVMLRRHPGQTVGADE